MKSSNISAWMCLKVATTSIRVAKSLSAEITKSDNMILGENFSKRGVGYDGRDYAPGTIPKQPTMRTLGQYHNMGTSPTHGRTPIWRVPMPGLPDDHEIVQIHVLRMPVKRPFLMRHTFV